MKYIISILLILISTSVFADLFPDRFDIYACKMSNQYQSHRVVFNITGITNDFVVSVSSAMVHHGYKLVSQVDSSFIFISKYH